MKHIYIIALALYQVSAFAHQDFRRTITYENSKVIVRITTGFDYEEISKVSMIGDLAGKILDYYKYEDPILLEFDHSYLNPGYGTDYFISFDKGEYYENDSITRENHGKVLERRCLVIRQVGHSFDFQKTIKLVEFALNNKSLIKNSQRKYKYDKGYNQYVISSIDTTAINNYIEIKASDVIKKIIKNTVDRPEFDDFFRISYNWSSDIYSVTLTEKDRTTKKILKLDNIKHFLRLYQNAYVFDTDSTFYLITSYYNKYKISDKFLIENLRSENWTYEINPISNDYSALAIYSTRKKQQNMWQEIHDKDSLGHIDLAHTHKEYLEYEVNTHYKRIIIIDTENFQILQSLNDVFIEK